MSRSLVVCLLLVLRFVFGAAISLVAGMISLAWGPRAAGMFLAFPAILPASLTLIEDKHSTERASADIKGGVIGGVAMFVFAAVALLMVNEAGAVAMGLALVAWLVTAIIIFLLVRKTRWFRRL